MSDTEPTVVIETPSTGPESQAEATETDVAFHRPRPRWSALIWGLLAIVAAVWALTLVGSPVARANFAEWWVNLGVGGLILVGVLALGALLLLQGVLALLKRASRPRD